MTLSDRLRRTPGGQEYANRLDAIADRYWHGMASMGEYNQAFWPALKWWQRHGGGDG